ncbi:13289_t:CDS:2, partial [Cetraspora pellucida]
MQQEIIFLVAKYYLRATMIQHILKKKFLLHSLFFKNLPNVLCFLVKQTKKSLYYTFIQSLIEEVESLADNESTLNEDLEDKLDNITLYTKYLLENLNQSAINKL